MSKDECARPVGTHPVTCVEAAPNSTQTAALMNPAFAFKRPPMAAVNHIPCWEANVPGVPSGRALLGEAFIASLVIANEKDITDLLEHLRDSRRVLTRRVQSGTSGDGTLANRGDTSVGVHADGVGPALRWLSRSGFERGIRFAELGPN